MVLSSACNTKRFKFSKPLKKPRLPAAAPVFLTMHTILFVNCSLFGFFQIVSKTRCCYYKANDKVISFTFLNLPLGYCLVDCCCAAGVAALTSETSKEEKDVIYLFIYCTTAQQFVRLSSEKRFHFRYNTSAFPISNWWIGY